ncbi:hypothetical protein, conserved [Trypanosoma brucei gambiense DAL972]|uniref:Uncharacterized protein n=2 Tax=Trypanosoma brucei TaxID=5691 RepID=C9ZP85_TRYB9|nr:hypothetical protein, conserved [Trypanosoma brucei gambiense DAL972]RHW72464.1 hypothetical protein DPX39_050031200 [Trypanosoma brucei equiperdum]CBH11213.1 hypothetical protein, conserved [Trypanosoma brucei gambiense DAL972]|eukprot:XP_011773500.1 hypothetical protein, conserved [Trypanosoma brucei gambiense DAL972]
MAQTSFTPLSFSTTSSWVTLDPNGVHISGGSYNNSSPVHTERRQLLQPLNDGPFASWHQHPPSSPGSTYASDDCYNLNTVCSEWSVLCVEHSPTLSQGGSRYETPREGTNQVRTFPTSLSSKTQQDILFTSTAGLCGDITGTSRVPLRSGVLRSTAHPSLRPQLFPFSSTNNFSPLSQIVVTSVFGRYLSQQLSTLHVRECIGSESDVDTSIPSRGSSPFAASRGSWDEVDHNSCCDEYSYERVSEGTCQCSSSTASQSCSEKGTLPGSVLTELFLSFVLKNVLSGTNGRDTYRHSSKKTTGSSRNDATESNEHRGWSMVSRWFVTNVEPLVVCTVYGIMVFVL